MRTLKRITTINIQSHKEVVIDLPETGLVRFSGDNSNGKSVITKVTSNLVSGTFANPKIRASIISNNAMAGEVKYETYDNYTLLCHLQRDAQGTYLELTRPNGEVIRRYASERGWKPIIEEFGFYHNKELDVLLQIVDDDSPMLYLATPPKTTYALINSAIADPVAEKALEHLNDIYSEAQSQKQELIKQKQVYTSAMEKFEIYDVEDLEVVLEKVEKLLQTLSNVYIPSIPSIPYMSEVHFYNLYVPKLPDMPDMPEVKFYNLHIPNLHIPPYPTFYSIYKPSLPNMANIMKDLITIQSGICPTCGKPFVEGLEHAC